KKELDNRLFEGFADTSNRRYVFLCNMQTNVSRWSKDAIEYFGLPGEYMENAGEIWAEHIHPEDRERYLADIREVFAGKKDRHDMDYRACNKEGEYVVCTCRGHVIKGMDGEPNLFVGSIENHGIMDNVDATTNLYNIYEFDRFMKQIRESNRKVTVLLVGINHFSDINDIYGYEFGNKVLREFGHMIRDVIKERGTVFRMDGVRFACCLEDCSKEELIDIYKQLQYQARHKIYIRDARIAVNISGGAVPYNENCDEHTVQTSANYAFEQSKHKYHGELVLFEHSLLQDNKKNLEFMNTIRNSIVNQFEGFYLCYQPIMNAKEEKLIGAEALLRWKKEPFGEVPPGIFIPWLENDPCFWDLGNWILKRAMTEGKKLLDKYPDFVLNVNIAYPQLSRPRFLEVVEEILQEVAFPAQNLCLELTERCRQLEREYLQKMVASLKEMGIKIAIDDFGTGFSSLNLLGDLPIDTLKIDRGFVWDIQTNHSNQAIVKAVTTCAEELDVHVCLEGLEDRKMIDFVKQYAVYSYQGYHFSKPITMDKFEEKYYYETES
ncbi:MAG: GGDEF and EAL domain-containing protein, partial [Lachnospiraceae bacterium]|nr:GGDEF and EAL domain-containing protein [Lachnospiraceae bacterium]